MGPFATEEALVHSVSSVLTERKEKRREKKENMRGKEIIFLSFYRNTKQVYSK